MTMEGDITSANRRCIMDRKLIDDILDRVEHRLANNSYGAYKQGVEDTIRAIYKEIGAVLNGEE